MNGAPVMDADRLSRWTGPHGVIWSNWHRQGGTSSAGVSVSWAETVEQEESQGGMEEWGVNNICHGHFYPSLNIQTVPQIVRAENVLIF